MLKYLYKSSIFNRDVCKNRLISCVCRPLEIIWDPRKNSVVSEIVFYRGVLHRGCSVIQYFVSYAKDQQFVYYLFIYNHFKYQPIRFKFCSGRSFVSNRTSLCNCHLQVFSCRLGAGWGSGYDKCLQMPPSSWNTKVCPDLVTFASSPFLENSHVLWNCCMNFTLNTLRKTSLLYFAYQ